jgi:flagellar basal body P-ring formation protein FlgA
MKSTLLFALLFISSQAGAQQPAPGARQDRAALRQAVEQFLQIQGAGLPGQVAVTVGAIDPRLNLAACAAPQAFLAPGARAWGNSTVGVRCTAPQPWTIYVQARVAVTADYVASAVPLAQGQPIQPAQVLTMKGDITALPPGIVTDMAQVVGRSLNVSLPSGMPLRLDALRAERVVQQGQLVRVVSSGAGFRVSAEGRAVGNASEGQVVQVRTAGGHQVSGVAKAGGLVEVAY